MQEYNEQPEDKLVGPKVIAWALGLMVFVSPFVFYGLYRLGKFVISLL